MTNFLLSWENGAILLSGKCCPLFHTKNEENEELCNDQHPAQASFAAYTMRTEGAGSHLDCSAKCDYWAEREGACNSYSFKGLHLLISLLRIILMVKVGSVQWRCLASLRRWCLRRLSRLMVVMVMVLVMVALMMIGGDGDYNCQVMVEQGLASVLERRCGGGHHCCRFLSLSS